MSLLEEIRDIKELVLLDESFNIDRLQEFSDKLRNCFKSGGRLGIVGNGGSAAEAMHIAAEFTGRCIIDHVPLPVVCLNESQSAITAIANDYGFDHVFTRLSRAHLKSGDMLIGLSTSGRSKNVLNCLQDSSIRGIECYLWTGGSKSTFSSAEIWRVPSVVTPRIQEVHLMWGHLIATEVESDFT